MVLPHEMHVCQADDDDLKEVDQLLWETLWRPVGLPRDVRQRFRLPGPEVALIFRRHGQLVGAVVGQVVDNHEMELRHLAIRPNSQRSGIGSALVRRLVEYCREHGYVSISTHARTTSQAFFEKQGFRAVPGQTLTHPAFEKHGINFQVMRRTLKQRQQGHCSRMTTNAIYRMIRPGEEQQAFSLVQRVFDEFVRSDFTQEGVAEFLRAARVMVFDQPSDHFVMVAELDGRIVGMIDMKENSHVSLLFVDARCHRQGIGRQLLDHALAVCRSARPDLNQVDVHSSLWAVPVYERLGFRQTKPEQTINGIRFVAMTKHLEPPKCDP